MAKKKQPVLRELWTTELPGGETILTVQLGARRFETLLIYEDQEQILVGRYVTDEEARTGHQVAVNFRKLSNR
jgi:hypothetical protein